MSNNIKPIVIGMVIGGIFTFGATYFIAPSENNSISKATSDEKKPIYWVAPMDANYKRDKPGKSPMGMDLVPVFDDDGKGPDEGPGTIRISSDVVNNLGVRTTTARYKPLHTKISTVG